MTTDPEFYLDNAATTALLPEALETGLPYLRDAYGNPSSLHRMGNDAQRGIKQAREALARLLAVPPRGITFTSGGTEADNLALKGAFASERHRGEELLISAIEHPAVLEAAQALEAQGVRVRTIPVTAEGVVDLAALERMLSTEVRMVSCMAVNNELGTVQPLAAIGALIRQHAPRALFHVDAVQGFTKVDLPFKAAGVDLATISAHKVHGPKGAGALVRFKPVTLAPQMHGGGHEGGLRSGTENPFAIVGFGAAAPAVARQHATMAGERRAYAGAWLEALAEYPRLRVFRSPHATPYVLNFSLPPVPGEVVLHHLEAEGLMVSTGSACSTHKREPSHVLRAVGMDDEQALASVRLSFSCGNTLAGLEAVLPAFRRAMDALQRV